MAKSGAVPEYRRQSSLLRLRKGTKSCYECRRRKLKCTYAEGSSSRCKECYARGTDCIEQDKVPFTGPRTAHSASKSNTDNGESRPVVYSLRERVARLEDFIETYLEKEKHEHAPATTESRNDPPQQKIQAAIPEPALLGPTQPARTHSKIWEATEQSPVLNLFNNNILVQIGRTENPFVPEMPTSGTGIELSTFDPTRFELLTLLPPEPDLNILVELSNNWWNVSPHRFPELFDHTNIVDLRSELSRKLSLPNPAETAKILLWTLISAERLSRDRLHDSTFRDPTAIAGLGSHVLPAIEKAVVFNDEVATTLPGIECLILLSRYYCNLGKLRKAWNFSRRALEYSISAGLHHFSTTTQATNTPHDQSSRKLRIWHSICYRDRYISMVLGLPYGIADSCLRGPGTGVLDQHKQNTTKFYVTISSIIGRIIDRNQKLSDDTLLPTLQIDQEFEDLFNNMDAQWWTAASLASYTRDENFQRIEAHFLGHFIRALLHLPFMLNFSNKGMTQFSYNTTVESSRRALVAYRLLRVELGLDPYMCTTIDFQVFVMSTLMILHLLGQHDDRSSSYTPEQNDWDWKSVADTTDILREAAKDSRNSVAKQAVTVLAMLLRAKYHDGPCPYGFDRGRRCKITIPCFGEITLAPGKKGPRCLGECQDTIGPSSLFSAPQGVGSIERALDQSIVPDDVNNIGEPLNFDTLTMTLGNVVALPNVNWTNDNTQPPGTATGANQWQSPGAPNFSSDLMQEWDLDFFGPQSAHITEPLGRDEYYEYRV